SVPAFGAAPKEPELRPHALLTPPSAVDRPACVAAPNGDNPSDLARRMSAALLGEIPVQRPKAAPAPRPQRVRWVCGEWTELWQGSGRGRTCEWREEPVRATYAPGRPGSLPNMTD